MNATNHNYYVSILTNKPKTVLYTGVTNDLSTRLRQDRLVEKAALLQAGIIFFTLFTLNAFNLKIMLLEEKRQLKAEGEVRKSR